MKPWQIIAIVVVVVAGVALVVFFATRREAPAVDAGEGEGGTSASDIVSGVGSGATGLIATIVRATENPN